MFLSRWWVAVVAPDLESDELSTDESLIMVMLLWVSERVDTALK